MEEKFKRNMSNPTIYPERSEKLSEFEVRILSKKQRIGGSYPSRTRENKLEAFFKPIKALAETQLTNIRKFDSDYLICFTHNGPSCLYFYGHNHEKER